MRILLAMLMCVLWWLPVTPRANRGERRRNGSSRMWLFWEMSLQI